MIRGEDLRGIACVGHQSPAAARDAVRSRRIISAETEDAARLPAGCQAPFLHADAPLGQVPVAHVDPRIAHDAEPGGETGRKSSHRCS